MKTTPNTIGAAALGHASADVRALNPSLFRDQGSAMESLTRKADGADVLASTAVSVQMNKTEAAFLDFLKGIAASPASMHRVSLRFGRSRDFGATMPA